MQPTQNSAPVSLHAQNNRVRQRGLVLLILGLLIGGSHLFAEAQQLIVPVSAANQAVIKDESPVAVPKEKSVSFDEKNKDWVVVMPLYETKVTVHKDWSSEAYIHRKVLVQKKEGIAFGEVPISYDADTEEIRILKAVTITPDGKEHPPAKIQDLSDYEEFGMYSNEKEKILSMPEVTVGSMIDLEYIKITKRLPMPKAFWDIEMTAQAFPIKEQKILYRIPKSLGIRSKSFVKAWKPEIKDEGEETVYSWERKNYGPDIDPEEVLAPLPTADNIEDGIEFSSLKNWQDVAVWYYGLIEKNMKVTPEIRQAAQKAVKGKKNLRDKVRAILEYMQENFRYVSMSFGTYSMEPHPTDEVFRNKYGDCKDQSLVMKAMLKAIGIEADLSLFGEERSMSDPKDDLPVPGLFDHLLLKVHDPEQGDFYADPLLEGYDIGEYPLKCQGAYTFIISAKGGQFDKLPISKEWIEESVSDTVEIRPDGSAIDLAEDVSDLKDSIGLRRKIRSMSAEEKKKFFQEIKNEMAAGGKVLEFSWDGLENKYGRVKSRAVTDRPDEYTINDGLMVIDLPSESHQEGWNAKERKKPIFYPHSILKKKSITYKIPKGFEVMHLPKGFDVDNGFFVLHRTIERTGDAIKVTESKRTRRIELPASEYPKIKEFFNKLPSRTEQRIILKKKGNSV